jgi:hypothetical protein
MSDETTSSPKTAGQEIAGPKLFRQTLEAPLFFCREVLCTELGPRSTGWSSRPSRTGLAQLAKEAL